MVRVLYNALIYTCDPLIPTAQAVAIENGKCLEVGSNDEILAKYGERAVKHNLHGFTVLPGLTDAHVHLHHYALSLQMVDCETTSKQETIQRVADKANKSPTGTWIMGHGWNQNSWNDGYGTAAELDLVTPNQPVYLTVKSLHAAWVNSKTLSICGITKDTPDPVGGKIQRDSAGNPTGILFETAMDLVQSKIPEPTPGQLAEMILTAQENLIRFGITGIHDFDRELCFSALQILHGQEKLNLRVVKNIPVEHLDHAIGIGIRSGFGDDHLRIGSVKMFSDGALGPKTAAMLESYEGDPGNTGILMLDGEALFETGRLAVQNGLSLTVHAIGDRANHEMINGFELLRKYEMEQHIKPLRHRIEHVQIIHPDDLPRLAKNQIIASMQPIHATSDMDVANRLWGKRSANAYAWKSIRNQGALLVFGSDTPVESPNPFFGIHAAVTRRRVDGTPGEQGWYPEQKLLLEEAIQGFTTAPAFTAGWENCSGKIRQGYFADCIVLPENIFSMPPENLAGILPVATMIGGNWIWQDIQI